MRKPNPITPSRYSRILSKIRREIANQKKIISRERTKVGQLYPRGTIHGLMIALSILKEGRDA